MRWIVMALVATLVAGGTYAISTRPSGVDVSKSLGRGPNAPHCCDAPGRAELVLALADGKGDVAAGKSDCPLFGGTPQRNMVNLVDKNVPTDWSVEEGQTKNIKWSAKLGSHAYGGPTVAGGRIYVGTNNSVPRDPKVEAQHAVVMAFDEADGKFLWQILHKTPPDELFDEGRNEGLCSTPLVEGDGIYYVTPGCVVVRANRAGKIVWSLDMMKELKVVPFHLGNCSPLMVGDLLVLITSNGVNADGKVASPKAPSLIAVDKNSGKVAWQSSLPGERIIQGQWTNPSLAEVKGKKQIIFPGGDSVIYGLDAMTGEMIWKCDCHPVRPQPGNGDVLTYFIASPVVVGEKIYIGLGVGPDLGANPKFSHLFCLDIGKTGDVSFKTYDAKDPANKGSALVWAFGGPIEPRPKTGRPVLFGRTISTCAVHDGLVYAAEDGGYIHCLDAATGERYWFDDLKAGVWGSPYYVDGKVYIGTEDGSIFIYRHGKKKDVLNTIDMGETIQSTPVVANGVLYIMTRSKLYAIVEKK